MSREPAGWKACPTLAVVPRRIQTPCIDGNKRAALGACLVFLRLNGIEPKPDGPEWEQLTLAVASSTIAREETTARLRQLLPRGT